METTNQQKTVAGSLVDAVKAEIAEQIRKHGIIRGDVDELAALTQASRGRMRCAAAPPFSPDTIASDGEIAAGISACKARIDRLTNKQDVLETRLTSAREQTVRLPAPRKSLTAIIVAAIGVFALAFSPTIYSVLFSAMDDTLFAWAVSILIGAAVGGFLCLLLLNFEEEE